MLQMIWMPRALAVGACLAWLRRICSPFTVSHSEAPYFCMCNSIQLLVLLSCVLQANICTFQMATNAAALTAISIHQGSVICCV